jgi:hypothetical protein
MFYLGIIVVVGLIAYLTQNKRERKFPTWLKVLFSHRRFSRSSRHLGRINGDCFSSSHRLVAC